MNRFTLASCLVTLTLALTGCGGDEGGAADDKDRVPKERPAKSRRSPYDAMSSGDLEAKLAELQRKVNTTQDAVKKATDEHQKASKAYQAAEPDKKAELLIAKSKAEATMKNASDQYEAATREMEVAQRAFVEKLRAAQK